MERNAARQRRPHPNNPNNFRYEKYFPGYDLVRATSPRPNCDHRPHRPLSQSTPNRGSGESFSQYDSGTAVGIMGILSDTKTPILATTKFPLRLREGTSSQPAPTLLPCHGRPAMPSSWSRRPPQCHHHGPHPSVYATGLHWRESKDTGSALIRLSLTAQSARIALSRPFRGYRHG